MTSNVIDLTGVSSDEEDEISAVHNGICPTPDLSGWQARKQAASDPKVSVNKRKTRNELHETPLLDVRTAARQDGEHRVRQPGSCLDIKQPKLAIVIAQRSMTQHPQPSPMPQQLLTDTTLSCKSNRPVKALAKLSSDLHLSQDGVNRRFEPISSSRQLVNYAENIRLKDRSQAKQDLTTSAPPQRKININASATNDLRSSSATMFGEQVSGSQSVPDSSYKLQSQNLDNEPSGKSFENTTHGSHISSQGISAHDKIIARYNMKPSGITMVSNTDSSSGPSSQELINHNFSNNTENRQHDPPAASNGLATPTRKTRELVEKLRQKSPSRGSNYSLEEDSLLIHLKEDLQLSWQQIGKYFPHRHGWQTLQVRYCTRLHKNKKSSKVETSHSGKSGPKDGIIRFVPEITNDSLDTTNRPKRQSRIDSHSDFNYYSLSEYDVQLEEQHSSVEKSRSSFQTNFEQISLSVEEENFQYAEQPSNKIFKNTSTAAKAFTPPKASHTLNLLRYERDLAGLAAGISYVELAHRSNTIRTKGSIRKSLNHDPSNTAGWIGRRASYNLARPFTTSEAPSHTSVKHGPGNIIRCSRGTRTHLSYPSPNGSKGNFPGADPQNPPTRSRKTVETLLRHRELGLNNKAYLQRVQKAGDTYSPTLLANGASGDINCVAWSPDGELFAAGAVALTDENSMQYNRPNNLLIGDADAKKLVELPKHVIARAAEKGPNASHEMQASQESYLFTSISSVCFTPDGNHMLSAGYDKYVRVWSARGGAHDVRCDKQIFCDAQVDVMEASSLGVYAIGMQSTNDSVWILPKGFNESSNNTFAKFSLPLTPAEKKSVPKPTCISWGNGYFANILSAGFSAEDDRDSRGTVCLWDVNKESQTGITRGSKSVFDIKWSPSEAGRFAVACKSSGGVNKGTKSVVKVFDSRILLNGGIYVEKQKTLELECEAMDANDLIFNPRDPNLVTLSCTNGVAYVWDLRKYGEPLHRLTHRRPLHEFVNARAREEQDLGVRFTSWDMFGRTLYTGSSDGLLALWDPYRAPQEAFQNEIVRMDSGIMAGAFSDDHHRLVLGDVQGSVMVLEKNMVPSDEDDTCVQPQIVDATAEKIKLRKMFSPSQINNESGIAAARHLVATGQIELRRCGDFPVRQAVQGPNYPISTNVSPETEQLRKSAVKLQQLLRANEPRDGKAKQSRVIVDGDVEDTGNWKARIPFHLRNDKTSRPFACLACQETIAPSLDHLACSSCGGLWEIGVLGFTPQVKPIPRSSMAGDAGDACSGSDDDTVCSHEMPTNALYPVQCEDEHKSLWEIDWFRLRYMQ